MSFASSYKYTLKLQFGKQAGFISVFLTMIMVIISLGVTIGFTYIHGSPDGSTNLFLATAGPTIIAVMTGLVLIPTQNVAAKAAGYIDFLRTLPVNRLSIILADATIYTLATLPGVIISLVVTHLMFSPGYVISPLVVLAYLLAILTCVGVGYGYSFALPAGLAMTISQIMAFLALMFSPISIPSEVLPMWLRWVHRVLPLESMADIMRATLASSDFSIGAWPWVHVALWCAGGFWLSVSILNKK